MIRNAVSMAAVTCAHRRWRSGWRFRPRCPGPRPCRPRGRWLPPCCGSPHPGSRACGSPHPGSRACGAPHPGSRRCGSAQSGSDQYGSRCCGSGRGGRRRWGWGGCGPAGGGWCRPGRGRPGPLAAPPGNGPPSRPPVQGSGPGVTDLCTRPPVAGPSSPHAGLPSEHDGSITPGNCIVVPRVLPVNRACGESAPCGTHGNRAPVQVLQAPASSSVMQPKAASARPSAHARSPSTPSRRRRRTTRQQSGTPLSLVALVPLLGDHPRLNGEMPMSKIELGSIGAVLSPGDSAFVDTAVQLEELGYETIWLTGGPLQSLSQIADVVLATKRARRASAVISVDRFGADDVSDLYAHLEGAHPGRFVVGLGGAHGPNPLQTMTAYLARLHPLPVTPPIMAALRPRT